MRKCGVLDLRLGLRLLLLVLLVSPLTPAANAAEAGESELWSGLARGDYIVLVRHALAPGNGDPAEFSLRDCATQRNLSGEGREQAQRIGARIKDAGLATVEVFSSQWCRCLETARLLGFGDVGEVPAFNSFYQRYEREEAQVKGMRAWLMQRKDSGPAVVVTHQVNITSLGNVFATSGEMVFISVDNGGDIEVVGRIAVE